MNYPIGIAVGMSMANSQPVTWIDLGTLVLVFLVIIGIIYWLDNK